MTAGASEVLTEKQGEPRLPTPFLLASFPPSLAVALLGPEWPRSWQTREWWSLVGRQMGSGSLDVPWAGALVRMDCDGSAGYVAADMVVGWKLLFLGASSSTQSTGREDQTAVTFSLTAMAS